MIINRSPSPRTSAIHDAAIPVPDPSSRMEYGFRFSSLSHIGGSNNQDGGGLRYTIIGCEASLKAQSLRSRVLDPVGATRYRAIIHQTRPAIPYVEIASCCACRPNSSSDVVAHPYWVLGAPRGLISRSFGKFGSCGIVERSRMSKLVADGHQAINRSESGVCR